MKACSIHWIRSFAKCKHRKVAFALANYKAAIAVSSNGFNPPAFEFPSKSGRRVNRINKLKVISTQCIGGEWSEKRAGGIEGC